MSAEKKQFLVRETTTAASKVIRLKPSTTDYVTFAHTTAKVLGLTGAAAAKSKPSRRVLSLMNLDS